MTKEFKEAINKLKEANIAIKKLPCECDDGFTCGKHNWIETIEGYVEVLESEGEG